MRPSKKKGLLFKPYGLCLPIPDYTIWRTKLWSSRVPKLSPSGSNGLTLWLKRSHPLTLLAQAVLDEGYGQEWLEIVFQAPDTCPICLSNALARK
ncbi:hypothetical protein TNIN_264901 [Trichonephila inaurata madagascariensis]|uniref:Uncharacterized protein n=1 Tax=Trichonephila inaurata madagascariensis TaxID=2747483 RepID=A0A8X6MLS1_9ARAC|nr:hypothetical protein TNIN_264901 [Trichonephila inaurata madagascariensis]